MAQPATNPKIEELRFRLKTDPKNRIFYPLAEELRKVGQFAEAEQVLRTGLAIHPSYLSAWVSLGRVLRDLKNETGAVEALNKALQLDPGNVVAARLLAEAYLALGEKVEAIKKYKLVHALLPADEEVEAIIDQLDRELNPPALAVVTEEPAAVAPQAADESPFAPETPPFEAPLHEAVPSAAPAETESPFAAPPPSGDETATLRPGHRRQQVESSVTADANELEAATPFAPAAVPAAEEPHSPWATDEAHVFQDAASSMQKEFALEEATGDAEPMLSAHAESPFEEPTSYGSAAFDVESPEGMHVARAPLAADVPLELPAGELPPEETVVPASVPLEEADVFAPAVETPMGVTREVAFAQTPAVPPAEDITSTLTMADLYAKQGLIGEARQIYDRILQRDPQNTAVRQKLAAIAQPQPPLSAGDQQEKVARLEGWLARVAKREVGGV